MKNKNFKRRALVFNPLVVAIYGIGCYYLSLLAKYGGVSLRAPIIIIAFLIITLWFIVCLSWYVKKMGKQPSTNQSNSSFLNRVSQFLFLLSLAAFILITFATGKSIYQSGTNLQGRLSFVIEDLLNKREVAFTHDNLYEDGLDGLFKDLETKINLPKDLYVANHFDLTFNKKGQITSFYSFLYGMNDQGEQKTFLIDYDSSKSKNMTVFLNGFTDPYYEETMRLQPLLDSIEVLPIKETVKNWNEEKLGIYYTGYRSWGYNKEGIVYFDKNGKTSSLETAIDEITGYTVSVYAPDDTTIKPVRFIDPSLVTPSLQEKIAPATQPSNEDELYYLNKKLGYQLSVTDAALGSRFYVLDQTTDGGDSWEMLNPDPFSGEIGTSTGITFITKNLGFIGLSHSGSTEADLYRTTDGGLTFNKVTFPPVDVPLIDTQKYQPFDFPEMPYEDNGALFLQIGQGLDGDYNGGSKVLYRSDDDGKTWEYTAEIK